MFLFFKPKPVNLYFYTTREDVFNHARPKKAIEFIPQWVKNLPHPDINTDPKRMLLHMGNLKTCTGFTNLYSSGFMIPMWSDLNIECNTEEYRYQFADRQSTIRAHPKKQIAGSRFNDTHFHLKIINPWSVYADSSVKLLFTAPVWNNFGVDDVVVAPGIMEPNVCLQEMNINLFFKKQEQSKIYSFLFGQPVMHVIPITDQKIKLNYELVTQEKLRSIQVRSPMTLMHLHRHQRAKKICPHV